MPLMTMDMRYLNEVAQGIRSFDRSLSVFLNQKPEEQLRILHQLEFMCYEAGADRYDGRRAVAKARLGLGFHALWRPGRKWYGIRINFATTKKGAEILRERDPKEF